MLAPRRPGLAARRWCGPRAACCSSPLVVGRPSSGGCSGYAKAVETLVDLLALALAAVVLSATTPVNAMLDADRPAGSRRCAALGVDPERVALTFSLDRLARSHGTLRDRRDEPVTPPSARGPRAGPATASCPAVSAGRSRIARRAGDALHARGIGVDGLLMRAVPTQIRRTVLHRADGIRATTASVAHHPGGRRSAHGAAASTCAASASSSSSSAGRAASITPTGRPSGVQCSGSETAGMPVTFQAEVQGVNAFWASKSRGRVGVVAHRADRQRRGGQGRRQHRVVRRERGQRVRGVAAHRPDRQPELRPADRPARARRASG